MLRYIVIDNRLFAEGNQADRNECETLILWLLEVVTLRNMRYLQHHPETPKLYDSGVVYALPDQMREGKLSDDKLEAAEKSLRALGVDENTLDIVMTILKGTEIFRDIPAILEKGAVDCDNLCAMRAAELRCVGIKAAPYITWREVPGGTTYHALVRWPDGTSEDPSLLLGMPERKPGLRAEEMRKNAERFTTFVAAAKALAAAGKASPGKVAEDVEAIGLLPKSGRWSTSG